MVKYIAVVFTVVFVLCSQGLASYYNTGMQEWKQPNGVEFTAQLWGDEFGAYMETANGYRIIEDTDGSYYYATLTAEGSLTPSPYRVGIDSPPSSAYKLTRSETRQALIDSQRTQFQQTVAEAGNTYRTLQQTSPQEQVFDMAIVLVQFQDVTHYIDEEEPITRPNGYFSSDFETMFFSENHTWDDWGDHYTGTVHPEGDMVYGSFRDYWQEQTLGNIDFSAQSGIINEMDTDGTPIWYTLEHDRQYYENYDVYNYPYHGLNAIIDELNLESVTAEYDRVAVVYAGPTRYLSNPDLHGLWPRLVERNEQSYFIMGERHRAINEPNNTVFTHIGPYTRLFGYSIGLNPAGVPSQPSQWYLMGPDYNSTGSMGYINGPTKNGACPAGITPYWRIEKDWVDFADIISTDQEGYEITYNYANPKYYKVEIPHADIETEQYFLLENRLRDGFDRYTPNSPFYDSSDPADPNGNEGGLLIWHIRPSAMPSAFLNLADNHNGNSDASLALDPFPIAQHQSLNMYTQPNTELLWPDEEVDSHIAFEDITWNEATKSTSVDIFTDFQGFSGTFVNDMTLAGSKVIYGDVRITGGATLTLQPGTQLSFVENSKLIIDAGSHLFANGSESNPILLTSNNSNPTVGDWNGIHLSGEANDASQLAWLTVEYAKTGLTIEDAYPSILHFTARYNTTGTKIQNVFPGSSLGHPLFRSSKFQDNTGTGLQVQTSFEQNPGTEHIVDCRFERNRTGIWVERGAPTISHSTIKGNHRAGSFLKEAPAIFANVEFTNNETVGVDAEYSKDFHLMEGTTISTTASAPTISTGIRLYESAPVLVGTVVQDNDLNGLLAFNSRAILKKSAILNNGHPATYGPEKAEIRFMDAKSLPLMAGEHNDIIDVDDPNSYLVYGDYERSPSDPWKVVYNYWGTTEDREIKTRLYPEGEYSYDPFDVEPNTEAGNEMIHTAGEAFQTAQTLEMNGNLAAAQTAYEEIITTYPNSPEALASVDRIIILAKKTERPLSDLQAYLENLVNTHPSEAVRTVAKEYLGQLALTAKEYATAAAMYGSLYTSATSTADSVYALIDQGYVVQQAVADSGGGVGKRDLSFTGQVAFRPSSTQEFMAGKTQLLEVLYGDQSVSEVLRQLNASSTHAVPTAFTLGQNYPNPFNPTTTIRYGVPDAGPVQLVVYDLTGRRIVTLVNTRQEAGTYTFMWDGRTATGVPAGSGVYFYRLTHGAQSATGKMVLIR